MIEMTRRFFARMVALLGAVFWSPAGYAAEADRIEAKELKALFDKGQAVIIDVRTQAAWDVGHIDGALFIPLAELEARLAQLPKDKLIVAYCT
jgi:rhodanese-related sulfurtransferase